MKNGIIQTIGKHVIAEDALAGGGVGVGVDESADTGIIVTRLEIVEPGLNIVYVAQERFSCSKSALFFNPIIRDFACLCKRKSPGIKRFQGLYLLGVVLEMERIQE